MVASDVVYQLTTLKACERSEHKVFLQENMKVLGEYTCDLFNFYLNYNIILVNLKSYRLKEIA